MQRFTNSTNRAKLACLFLPLAFSVTVASLAGCSKSAPATDATSMANPKSDGSGGSHTASNSNGSSHASSGKSGVVGKWMIDLSKMDIGTGKQAEMAKQMAPTTYILFTKDGQSESYIEGTKIISGPYVLKGHTVTFPTTGTGTMKVENTSVGVFNDDWTLLTMGSGKQREVFKRSK